MWKTVCKSYLSEHTWTVANVVSDVHVGNAYEICPFMFRGLPARGCDMMMPFFGLELLRRLDHRFQRDRF
jgi:hypothetical protein